MIYKLGYNNYAAKNIHIEFLYKDLLINQTDNRKNGCS